MGRECAGFCAPRTKNLQVDDGAIAADGVSRMVGTKSRSPTHRTIRIVDTRTLQRRQNPNRVRSGNHAGRQVSSQSAIVKRTGGRDSIAEIRGPEAADWACIAEKTCPRRTVGMAPGSHGVSRAVTCANAGIASTAGTFLAEKMVARIGRIVILRREQWLSRDAFYRQRLENGCFILTQGGIPRCLVLEFH